MLLCFIVIILCASIVLQFNQSHTHVAPKHLKLSIQGKQTLTDLRNAAEEISFLSVDSTTALTLAELKEFQLPPFYNSPGTTRTYQWSQPSSGCYIGIPVDNHNPLFMLHITQEIEIFWKLNTHQSG